MIKATKVQVTSQPLLKRCLIKSLRFRDGFLTCHVVTTTHCTGDKYMPSALRDTDCIIILLLRRAWAPLGVTPLRRHKALTEDMAPRLGVLAALTDDLGLTPSTHMVVHNHP